MKKTTKTKVRAEKRPARLQKTTKQEINKYNKIIEVIDYFELSYYTLGAGIKFVPIQLDNIKRQYLKLLLFAPDNIRITYQGLINTWETQSKTRILRDVRELQKEIEKHNPELRQESESLKNIIHWVKVESILKKHLQILKDEKIIYFDNIKDVLSGDKQASFINKHKRFKIATCNVLSLFKYWNDNGYIIDFIIIKEKEDKIKKEWKYKTIEESFLNNGKPFDKYLKTEMRRYFKNKKSHKELIPPVYDYFSEILQ